MPPVLSGNSEILSQYNLFAFDVALAEFSQEILKDSLEITIQAIRGQDPPDSLKEVYSKSCDLIISLRNIRKKYFEQHIGNKRLLIRIILLPFS